MSLFLIAQKAKSEKALNYGNELVKLVDEIISTTTTIKVNTA